MGTRRLMCPKQIRTAARNMARKLQSQCHPLLRCELSRVMTVQMTAMLNHRLASVTRPIRILPQRRSVMREAAATTRVRVVRLPWERQQLGKNVRRRSKWSS